MSIEVHVGWGGETYLVGLLAVGGDKSFGPTMAIVGRNVAGNLQEAIVPNAGHWLMEENPQAVVSLVRNFLKTP